MADQEKSATATLYLRVKPELRLRLKEIALAWERQRGHRVTINDVGEEALEAFVRDYDKSPTQTGAASE